VCPVDSLLIRARDGPGLVLEDSLRARRQGWAKIVLFALYFRPKVVVPAVYKNGPIPNIVDGYEWDSKWCVTHRNPHATFPQFSPPFSSHPLSEVSA
jgi:hypothetical protein